MIFNCFVLLFVCLNLFLFKGVLIKLLVFITGYPLISMTFMDWGFPMYGLLGLMDLSSDEFYWGYVLYFVGYFVFCLILYPVRNILCRFRRFYLSKQIRLLLLLFMFATSFLVMNIHSGGMASATLYLTTVVILIASWRRDYFITGGMIAISLLLILKGERVDSILFLLLLMVLTINDYIVEVKLSFKIYIIVCSVILLGLLGALFREGNSLSFNTMLLFDLYSQKTVADSLHIYYSGISYYLQNGAAFEVLYNTLFGLIPGPFYGLTSLYNYNVFLAHNFEDNVGGGMFCTEGLLAFGPLGVPLYFALAALIYKKLILSKSRISSLILLLFLIMACRIFWYGFIYVYKPVLFLCLFNLLYVHRLKYLRKSHDKDC